jgi:hypothetical protein
MMQIYTPGTMRARLLSVIGVSLWSATAAGQTPSPAALPAELRTHVQSDRFGIVSSVRGLPLGVRHELQALFGSPTLDIAEPGEEFQATGQRAESSQPTRRLVAAGCSYEDCLVYYERGGSPRTWRVALFHWRPNETKLEWGGVAPGGLTTIEDVRKAVLSGTMKASRGPW